MKAFTEFEKNILLQISAFQKDGIISFKTILEKTFFNIEKEKALIVQLREQYAIYFLSTHLFNSPVKRKNAIVEYSQFIHLLNYLHNEGIIILFKSRHYNKASLSYVSDLFDEPHVNKDNKLILNKSGLYSSQPEEIKNKEDHIVYRGIEISDNGFLTQNSTANIIISDKINDVINKFNVPKGKSYFKKIPFSHSIQIITLLLLISWFVYSHYLNKYVSKTTTIQQKNNLNLSKKNNSVSLKSTQKKTKVSIVKKYGIDISQWNGNILNQQLPDSLSFAICKATEGINFTDPEFETNWKEIKSSKLKRGAYHFFVYRDNPKDQALFFWEHIKNRSSDDFAPIVDIESASFFKSRKPDPKILQERILTFLNELEQLSKVTPMIYSSHFFASKYITKSEFAKYPLWIADYISDNEPRIPNVWKNKGWEIWQKSATYDINSKHTDFDIFKERQ